MLRDSLQAGVPPQMIPLIFAGISPGGLPASMLELTQQYLTQPSAARSSAPQMPVMSHAHPHAQRRPTHVRQDSRTIPSNAYVAPPVHPQTVPPPGVLLSQPLHAVGASPTPQPLGRPSVSNGPADPRFTVAAIPRMNPGESQLQPPINLSNVHYAPGSSIPSTQPPRGKSDSSVRRSPPSLYFHHWVPPGQTTGHAPPGRGRQESPGTVQGSRHVDSNVSPGRKRKAHGAHHPAPLPSSRLPESFPGSSQTSQPGSPGPEYHFEQAAPPTHHHHSLPRSSDASASYQILAEDVKREHRSRGTSPTHSSERMNVDDARPTERDRADEEEHYQETTTSAGHASPHTARVQRSEAASYHDPRSSPARSPTRTLQPSKEYNLASGD